MASKKLDIVSWNVNGIRAAEKKGFLPWLQKASPDILCVQETRATVDQLSQAVLKPAGYEVHWVSGEKKGYCGVAIFTKRKPHDVRPGFGVGRFDCEGRVITADYDEFTLMNVYFPNGGRGEERVKYKLDFYDETLRVCQKMRANNKRLIICGDYNTAHRPIDLERPVENQDVSGFLPVERAWLDKFISHGYVDTFRALNPDKAQAYTWWDQKSRARDRNVGWRIDYHFITEDLRPHLKDAYIRPDVMGSDHCPAGITLSF